MGGLRFRFSIILNLLNGYRGLSLLGVVFLMFVLGSTRAWRIVLPLFIFDVLLKCAEHRYAMGNTPLLDGDLTLVV